MVEVLVDYVYTAEQDDELSINVGDIVKNVVRSEGGWWEGELNGKRGLFPDNFVKVINDPDKKDETKKEDVSKKSQKGSSVRELANKLKDGVPIVAAPQKKKEPKKYAKAEFAYEPEAEDELKIEVGDVIEILKQEEEGWLEGSVHGRVGIFPSNFVKIIEESEMENGEDKDKGDNLPKVKKVKGVGLGNIFEGGPIKLRSTGPGSSIKKTTGQPATQDGKPDTPELPVVTTREKKKNVSPCRPVEPWPRASSQPRRQISALTSPACPVPSTSTDSQTRMPIKSTSNDIHSIAQKDSSYRPNLTEQTFDFTDNTKPLRKKSISLGHVTLGTVNLDVFRKSQRSRQPAKITAEDNEFTSNFEKSAELHSDVNSGVFQFFGKSSNSYKLGQNSSAFKFNIKFNIKKKSNLKISDTSSIENGGCNIIQSDNSGQGSGDVKIKHSNAFSNEGEIQSNPNPSNSFSSMSPSNKSKRKTSFSSHHKNPTVNMQHNTCESGNAKMCKLLSSSIGKQTEHSFSNSSDLSMTHPNTSYVESSISSMMSPRLYSTPIKEKKQKVSSKHPFETVQKISPTNTDKEHLVQIDSQATGCSEIISPLHLADSIMLTRRRLAASESSIITMKKSKMSQSIQEPFSSQTEEKENTAFGTEDKNSSCCHGNPLGDVEIPSDLCQLNTSSLQSSGQQQSFRKPQATSVEETVSYSKSDSYFGSLNRTGQLSPFIKVIARRYSLFEPNEHKLKQHPVEPNGPIDYHNVVRSQTMPILSSAGPLLEKVKSQALEKTVSQTLPTNMSFLSNSLQDECSTSGTSSSYLSLSNLRSPRIDNVEQDGGDSGSSCSNLSEDVENGVSENRLLDHNEDLEHNKTDQSESPDSCYVTVSDSPNMIHEKFATDLCSAADINMQTCLQSQSPWHDQSDSHDFFESEPHCLENIRSQPRCESSKAVDGNKAKQQYFEISEFSVVKSFNVHCKSGEMENEKCKARNEIDGKVGRLIVPSLIKHSQSFNPLAVDKESDAVNTFVDSMLDSLREEVNLETQINWQPLQKLTSPAVEIQNRNMTLHSVEKVQCQNDPKAVGDELDTTFSMYLQSDVESSIHLDGRYYLQGIQNRNIGREDTEKGRIRSRVHNVQAKGADKKVIERTVLCGGTMKNFPRDAVYETYQMHDSFGGEGEALTQITSNIGHRTDITTSFECKPRHRYITTSSLPEIDCIEPSNTGATKLPESPDSGSSLHSYGRDMQKDMKYYKFASAVNHFLMETFSSREKKFKTKNSDGMQRERKCDVQNSESMRTKFLQAYAGQEDDEEGGTVGKRSSNEAEQELGKKMSFVRFDLKDKSEIPKIRSVQKKKKSFFKHWNSLYHKKRLKSACKKMSAKSGEMVSDADSKNTDSQTEESFVGQSLCCTGFKKPILHEDAEDRFGLAQSGSCIDNKCNCCHDDPGHCIAEWHLQQDDKVFHCYKVDSETVGYRSNTKKQGSKSKIIFQKDGNSYITDDTRYSSSVGNFFIRSPEEQASRNPIDNCNVVLGRIDHRHDPIVAMFDHVPSFTGDGIREDKVDDHNRIAAQFGTTSSLSSDSSLHRYEYSDTVDSSFSTDDSEESYFEKKKIYSVPNARRDRGYRCTGKKTAESVCVECYTDDDLDQLLGTRTRHEEMWRDMELAESSDVSEFGDMAEVDDVLTDTLKPLDDEFNNVQDESIQKFSKMCLDQTEPLKHHEHQDSHCLWSEHRSNDNCSYSDDFEDFTTDSDPNFDDDLKFDKYKIKTGLESVYPCRCLKVFGHSKDSLDLSDGTGDHSDTVKDGSCLNVSKSHSVHFANPLKKSTDYQSDHSDGYSKKNLASIKPDKSVLPYAEVANLITGREQKVFHCKFNQQNKCPKGPQNSQSININVSLNISTNSQIEGGNSAPFYRGGSTIKGSDCHNSDSSEIYL